MYKKVLSVVLSMFVFGCAQPNLYQKETASMIAEIVKASNNAKIVQLETQNDGKIINEQKNGKQFNKLFEWFIDFDGVKDWWKIANFNSPNVKYIIFIINGTNGTGYETGGVIDGGIGKDK